MQPSRFITNLQLLVTAAAVVLGLYYVFVFRSVARQARSLDAPLTNAWQRIASAPVQPAPRGPDLGGIQRQHERAQQSLEGLSAAARTLTARLEADPETRRRMREPFQLVEFHNERQTLIEDLDRFARLQKIGVDKAVFDGFPEFSGDLRQPELLWARLAAARQIVHTALQCKVTALNRLQMPAPRMHTMPATEEKFAYTLPARLELVGPMDAIAQLLNLLPRTEQEIKSLGLPEAPPGKPPIFITGLAVRKNSTERPNEVTVVLQTAAFVFQE